MGALVTSDPKHRSLGANLVLVVPGRVDRDTSPSTSWTRSADAIATRLVPLAERLGVTIGIENTWRSPLLTPGEVVRYVDELDSLAVGAFFDAGNVVFGHPEHWVGELGSRLVGVHYKDYFMRTRGRRGSFGFVAAGHGDVDWARVDQALVEAGYDGWLTHTTLALTLPMRLALRLDGEVSQRAGPVAAVADRMLSRPRLRLHEKRLREMAIDAATRDAVLSTP